jgi:LEA14-like dessication related protein
MKKNAGLLILIILIILNLIFGGSLLYIITIINAPDIIASIEILELNENEIIIETEIEINNTNFFSIIIGDFNINCKTENELEFGNMTIKGGEVLGSSNSKFIGNGSFSFNNYDFEPIINEINGEIGFSFFGVIKKSVPINILLIAELEDVITDIKPPKIKINAEISEITDNGISFEGNISVYNPNNFEILLDDILLNIESELGESIGSIDIISDVINPNSYNNFLISGDLSYYALNADIVNINLNAKVGAHIAGFEKIINISTKTQFRIPDIQDILLINRTMDFSISAEFKLRLDGVLTKVGFKIYNPSEIPLQANDLICYIYSYDNNETNLIVQNDMESCTIPSKNEVCIKTEVTIPYISLITSGNNKIFPEWFVITIEGSFSINGTDQYIPISFNGYISPHFLLD